MGWKTGEHRTGPRLMLYSYTTTSAMPSKPPLSLIKDTLSLSLSPTLLSYFSFRQGIHNNLISFHFYVFQIIKFDDYKIKLQSVLKRAHNFMISRTIFDTAYYLHNNLYARKLVYELRFFILVLGS